jgi:hypothetical protein
MDLGKEEGIMTKDASFVRVVYGSCEARYTVQVSWLDSAMEFDCSCGARLKADVDDLFQVQHDMKAPAEITLHPLQSGPEMVEVTEHARQ